MLHILEASVHKGQYILEIWIIFLCREVGGEERKEGPYYMPSLLGFSILIIPIQSENPNATWEELASIIHAGNISR